MKICMAIVVFFLCVLSAHVSGVSAGLEDVFNDMKIQSTRPLGTGEYLFNPGDKIVQESNYIVYYSGNQTASAVDTLHFTVFEEGQNYPIFFTAPDIIKIKDVTIRIISYDNISLRLQFLQDGFVK